MRWNDVIGQDRIADMLQRSIIEERIPQAVLLTGAEGTGKVPLALAFATTVNCQRPVRSGKAIAACGTCQSCIQAAGMQHPNIRMVMALPAGKGDTDDEMKSDLIEEVRDRLHGLVDDPYAPLRIEGATQIRIGQIRELKRTLSLSAAQRGRRIVIVHEAHEMTTEAANAFLKTLEEPHAEVTIILTSSHPERMLPTIVSRCQEIVCPPLDDQVIVALLTRRGLCTADEAALIAPFAEGSVTKAFGYLDEDMRGYRETVVQLLRTALRGKDHRIGLVEMLDDVTEGRNKTRLELMLSLLMLWLRDAYAIEQGGSEVRIINVDQRDALTRFAEAYHGADYMVVFSSIDEAVRNVHRNVAPVLIVIPMMLRLRSLFMRARQQSSAGGAS